MYLLPVTPTFLPDQKALDGVDILGMASNRGNSKGSCHKTEAKVESRVFTLSKIGDKQLVVRRSAVSFEHFVKSRLSC